MHELETSRNPALKAKASYILSELWRDGVLNDSIKDTLVDHYYKVTLLQVYGNYQAPNFVVQCQQSFPFPDTWTEFTPILYKNGEVEWAPPTPQRAHAMSQNSSVITSRIGGLVNNGDVLYYMIKIRQNTPQGKNWEKMVKTNEIVAHGLKQLVEIHDNNS